MKKFETKFVTLGYCFVLIFVLMLALKLGMPILQQWVADNSLPK